MSWNIRFVHVVSMWALHRWSVSIRVLRRSSVFSVKWKNISIYQLIIRNFVHMSLIHLMTDCSTFIGLSVLYSVTPHIIYFLGYFWFIIPKQFFGIWSTDKCSYTALQFKFWSRYFSSAHVELPLCFHVQTKTRHCYTDPPPEICSDLFSLAFQSTLQC